ncbi:hypothetical protein D3C81_2113090 [compost metagenome]
MGNVIPRHMDLTAINLSQTCDTAQQGRLAATAGAEQGQQFAFLDSEIDVVKHPGLVRAFAERFR